MADMTIEINAESVFDALEALGISAEAHVKAAAFITADNIAREAKARVARRTGETASHIVVEELHNKHGYIVWVEPDVRISSHTMPSGRTHTQRVSYNAVGSFLEFGTRFMTARPFLFASGRLEEGAHERRMREAVQDALDEAGWK